MKPGERIRLITESANMLIVKPWADMQLVLGEFGFKTWDDQSAGPEEYCREAIRAGQDERIVELHGYLTGEDVAPTATSPVDGPWSGLPVRVFFSHVQSNRHFVGQVKKQLAARWGIDAFVAHDDVNPSKHWREVIKAGLATCDMFVAFLDPGFHESQWCDQEVGWALARNVPVLPVRPAAFDRSTARDGFLEERQDVLLSAAPKGARADYWLANSIFQNLFTYSKLADSATKALVEAFVASASYETTRRLWTMLLARQTIETEQLRRLEYAVATNSQVYECIVDSLPIPDLVRALIEKFEPPEPSYVDEPPF